MRLSIVMPVYNEIATIAEIIRRVLEAPVEVPKELIIVDDYPTDGTREYLQRLGRGEGSGGETVKVLFHERNLGKGAAIRTEVLKQIQLRSNRFGFELEIVIKVAKLGCRISEVPIAYRGRSYSEGKKIGWREQIPPLRRGP